MLNKMLAKEDIKFGFITTALPFILGMFILEAISGYIGENFSSLLVIAICDLIVYVVLSLILSYAHCMARIKKG